jgi:hypothetical protein
MSVIHQALVEGLNKFVEMIIAPINARLDAIEVKQSENITHTGTYTTLEVDRMLNEQREMCNQVITQRMDQQMDSMRDYVGDCVNDKFDNDLSDAVRDVIDGLNISAEITVRR